MRLHKASDGLIVRWKKNVHTVTAGKCAAWNLLPACLLAASPPRRLAGQFNKINDCVDDDVVISRTLQPIRCVSENVYGAQCRSDYILLLVASRQQ